MSEQFVQASVHVELQRAYDKLQEDHTRLAKAAREVQSKAYAEGRDDARREYLRLRSDVGQGDGLAHLTLPDNGGAIQFHAVGPMGTRPLTGGILSKDPDFLLRIWGPPDETGSYGVHEQGGGNLTDFSMAFDLTPDGLVVHRMEHVGVRTKWDRE